MASSKKKSKTERLKALPKYQDGKGNKPVSKKRDDLLFRLERDAEEWLGYPQEKARALAVNEEDPGGDSIDNIRHAQAGRLTGKAIEDKTGNIPYISKGLGFIGATIAGIGHEIGNPNMSLSGIREAGEDIYNNTYGAYQNLKDITDEERSNNIFRASFNNQLPDGYGTGNMYFGPQGSPNKAYNKKQNGGWLDTFEDGGKVDKFNKAEAERFQSDINKQQAASSEILNIGAYNKYLQDKKPYDLSVANYTTALQKGYTGNVSDELKKDPAYMKDLAERRIAKLRGYGDTTYSVPGMLYDILLYDKPKEVIPEYRTDVPTVRAQATMSEEAKPIPVPEGPKVTPYTNADYLKAQGLPYGTKHVPGVGRVEVKEDGGQLPSYKDGKGDKPSWLQPLPTSASIGSEDNKAPMVHENLATSLEETEAIQQAIYDKNIRANTPGTPEWNERASGHLEESPIQPWDLIGAGMITATGKAAAKAFGKKAAKETVEEVAKKAAKKVELSDHAKKLMEPLADEYHPKLSKVAINKTKGDKILDSYRPSPDNVEVGNINWGKWNPEIPKNKSLMAEYNAIEETTKRNGTWMKNPDGTPFKGEPEQFVQQNSKNFKKFYEDSKVTGPNGEPLFMYHGSPNKDIQSFLKPGDKGYSKSPSTTTGESGIYFSDIKEYSDKYRNFADPSQRTAGKTYQTYLAPKTAITAGETSSAGITEGLSPAFLWHHGPVPVDAVKAGTAMRKLYDKHGYEVAMENPNLIKSAIGNNGMFDITNPNIYKALTGVTAGGTAAAATQEKKDGGWLDEL